MPHRKLNRQEMLEILEELLHIPDCNKFIMLTIHEMFDKFGELITHYRKLRSDFRKDAYPDIRIYEDGTLREFPVYHFKLNRRSKNRWSVNNIEPQLPEGTELAGILPPPLISRMALCDIDPEKMETIHDYFDTPGGRRLFDVRFSRYTHDHMLGNVRISESAEGKSSRSEDQIPGSKESSTVVKADRNDGEEYNEDHFDDLFYCMRAFPEVKQRIFEDFYNRIRPRLVESSA
jgi:hypothetical protein